MSTTRARQAAPVRFRAELSSIDDVGLVRLPEAASEQLPSRGQVAVHATIDAHPFETVVEPDGRRGHWVRVDRHVQEAADVHPGDTAELTLEVAPDWPEPDLPDDLAAALDAAPPALRDIWQDITPMARWEWVRWVRATANPATRQRRVEVSISKMSGGKRRPCCFDLASCTDPELARGGRLREW
ncbi:MAG TPA: YdeI/OmpD-associated family protein [Dermatophilaceae bacterium]|nr:YdeI/OmpD-associated family protein [Dermatophilaceae bacterium]